MVKEGEILTKWLESKRWSPLDLARELNLTKQAVYYHLDKESIPESFKKKLRDKKFDVFSDLSKKSNIVKSNAVELNEINVMMVPFVHKYARAGYLTGYGDEEFMDELPKIPMIIESQHKGKYIAIEVKGESMFDESYNSYLEGDIVFGREVQKHHWQNKLHINKWDFIIVHKEEGILVKRIISHDVANATITIHSLNDEFEDQILHLNDILEIYNVVKIEREMKR